MICKNIFITAAMLATLPVMAQETELTAPALADMEGDYIVLNYKEYDDVRYLSDMKSMHVGLNDDALAVEGFYMTGCSPFTATYDETSGTIGIAAGTEMLHFPGYLVQYLYAWNEEDSEVYTTPANYLYTAEGLWEAEKPLVLMSGVEGGELSPYYFGQASQIRRSNAVTENLSFAGLGADQDRYEESRPSYVELNRGKLTIYNMLQTDQYGYGCMFEGTYTADGRVTFNPQVVGQSNDGTYKVLAGCTWDDTENRPLEVTDAGGRSEGCVRGTIDLATGVIEIEPMAIWVGEVKGNGVAIAASRSYFEFVRSVKTKYEIAPTNAANDITDEVAREVASIEYYTTTGQRTAPVPGMLLIRHTRYTDGTTKAEKIFVK